MKTLVRTRNRARGQALTHDSADFRARVSSILTDTPIHSAPRPPVIILSRAADEEANALGVRLAYSGVDYARLDVDRITTPGPFHFSVDDTATTGHVDNTSIDLDYGHVILLRHFDVDGVPIAPEDPPSRKFLTQEWAHMLQVLARTSRATWVNDPDRIQSLDRLTQLRLARQQGLGVPQTLVATDPYRVLNFAQRFPNGVVAKSLGTHFVEEPSCQLHSFMPRVLPDLDDDFLAECQHVPTIYQEYIEALQEVRVTIAGDRVLAYAYHKSAPDQPWTDPSAITPYDHQLPGHVKDSLFRFMEAAGLRLGQIDLLYTANGRYYFLEVNPTGDWLWLESSLSGRPITQMVLEYLTALVTSS